MSIPAVINMHNVFHNPAQYNYASLFQNTLALAFSKAHNTCLFALLVLCLPFFFFFFPCNDKEAAKRYLARLRCWTWTCIRLKLDADLKLGIWRDRDCVVNCSFEQTGFVFLQQREQQSVLILKPHVFLLLSCVNERVQRGDVYVECVCIDSDWRAGGASLSLYTVTCPLITDYHRLFVLWPVALYKISHRSWRMLGNSLSGIQHGTGIFGKSNFISTNMRKMKTNTTQTANYHPLGPLSSVFLRRRHTHKMADRTTATAAGETFGGRRQRQRWRRLAPSKGQTLVVWIMQVDTPLAPVIFQPYYLMCKVINYTTDTSLVSSGPCGLNQRQILCH